MNTLCRMLLATSGACLTLAVWLALKYGLSIEERYLPSPLAVLRAFVTVDDPNMVQHTLCTTFRIVAGLLAGTIVGIAGGVWLFSSHAARLLLMPTVQSFRSVPPIAAVPFILIWFGFAETGKVLLVLIAVSLNVLVATAQILADVKDKYVVAFNGFGMSSKDLPLSFLCPIILESLLPTVRFSLSLAIGVVVVSELLGSQIGLGYLIQTSRTTYAMHTIFAAVFILGALNWTLDWTIRYLWSLLVFWRPRSQIEGNAV